MKTLVIDRLAAAYRDRGSGPPVVLDCPTTLVKGSRTRRPARTVVELLAGAIRGAQVYSIPGAGHMSRRNGRVGQTHAYTCVCQGSYACQGILSYRLH